MTEHTKIPISSCELAFSRCRIFLTLFCPFFDPGWPLTYPRKRVNSQNCEKFYRKRYSVDRTWKTTNFQPWNSVSCMAGSVFTLTSCLTLSDYFLTLVDPSRNPKRNKQLKLRKNSTGNDILLTEHVKVPISSCELVFLGWPIFSDTLLPFVDPRWPLVYPK